MKQCSRSAAGLLLSLAIAAMGNFGCADNQPIQIVETEPAWNPAPRPLEEQPPQVSPAQIADYTDNFTGARVTVSAPVRQVFNEHLLALDQRRLLLGPQVLVLNPQPRDTPPEGVRVTVIGQVRRLARAEFARQYAWFNPLWFEHPGIPGDWEGGPVIIAEAVLTPTGRDLVQGPPLQPEAVGAPNSEPGVEHNPHPAEGKTIVRLQTILDAEEPLALAGRPVELLGVSVQRIIDDRTLVVGPSWEEQLIVRLARPNHRILTGDRLLLRGTLRRRPETLADWRLAPAGRRLVEAQPVFLEAAQAAILNQ